MYELPFGRGKTWMTSAPALVDLALGGWQVSLVSYVQSGGYLTPTISVPDPTGTRFTSTATRPTVTLRPDQLRDPELSDPTVARWFDPGAYAAPPIGRFGTAERGSIVGPALNLWHFGVHKKFRLTDSRVGTDAAHRTDLDEHLQHAAVCRPGPERVADQRERRSNQRHRRHRRLHSAGGHEGDAARFPNGLVNRKEEGRAPAARARRGAAERARGVGPHAQ